MGSDYRMTVEDETRATAAMRETVRTWQGPRERGIDRDALVRIGAHAIGCGLEDLRASEVDWMTGRAQRTIDDEAGR